MTRPFVTSSGVDLFGYCRASAVMPRRDEYSDAATRGTEVHGEVLRPGGMSPIMLDWFGHEPRYEVSLGWEVTSGRALVLGENQARAYELPDDPPPEWVAAAAAVERLARDPATPEGERLALSWLRSDMDSRPPSSSALWLAGTADATAVRSRVVSVADLKTGFHQTRGGLPAPGRSGQLRSLAWYLWQAVAHRSGDLGWEPDRIRLAWFLQPEGGDPSVEDVEVRPDELRAWATRLGQAALATRAAPTPVTNTGPWCVTCPCFDACPAQGGALKRLSDLPGDVVTDEDAAIGWFASRTHERAGASAKTALATYVERRRLAGAEVEIGGGRVLRHVTAARREIDAALAVGSGVLPPGAVSVSVSLDSVRTWLSANPQPLSSVRPLAPGEADRPATPDDYLAALEVVGATRTSQTKPFLQVIRKR